MGFTPPARHHRRGERGLSGPAGAHGPTDRVRSGLFDAISASKLTTIEQVIGVLPAEYKEHYVLAYAGRGAQSSTAANPRVISFGDDAHLILTFNGSLTQSDYDMLELAEFNQAASEYEYSFITLDGHSASRSQTNPARCTSCHGARPRTIYNDYPSWPGFYGSNSEARLNSPDEVRAFVEYRTLAATHPRYSQLSQRFWPDLATGAGDPGVLHRPNNLYGKLLSRHQAIRLAADLLSQPEVRSKIISYLAWNFHLHQGACPEWDATVKASIFAPLERFARARIAARYPGHRYPWAQRLDADSVMVEQFELSLGTPDVFTERMVPVTAVSAASGPDARVGYNDGLDEMQILVGHALVRRLQKERGLFNELFEGVRFADFAVSAGSESRYNDGSAELFDSVLPRVRVTQGQCDRLARAALAEWP